MLYGVSWQEHCEQVGAQHMPVECPQDAEQIDIECFVDGNAQVITGFINERCGMTDITDAAADFVFQCWWDAYARTGSGFIKYNDEWEKLLDYIERNHNTAFCEYVNGRYA